MSNKNTNDTNLNFQNLRITPENKHTTTKMTSCFDSSEDEDEKEDIDEVKDEIMKEINDRESRKTEIIIFKIPESLETNARGETAMEHDKRLVREIFKHLGFDDNNLCVPKYLKRLGALVKIEDRVENPRPLIVSFYTQHEKELIVSKAKLLKDSKEFGNIGLHENRTVKQREQIRMERELVKERNEKKVSLKEGEEWAWITLGVIKKRKVQNKY